MPPLPTSSRGTVRIILKGRVQGVGFRPFVYQLALRFGLAGTVSNNEEGVVIYASGPRSRLQAFGQSLIDEAPEVSRIQEHRVEEVAFRPFEGFSIVPSSKTGQLNLQLTPDLAICPNCQLELSDPSNRRFHYPFITCVHCGPRWAVTRSFPFERAHTSLSGYRMCKACAAEYGDPGDGRFHSQTNSCPDCGVSLWLTDARGETLENAYTEVFRRAAGAIRSGRIIAVQNSSGYLLCCDANSPTAVQRLRDRKRRPRKPFALLYPSIELLRQELSVGPEEEAALLSPERPIVLIPTQGYRGELALEELAPGLNQLGIMLPYTGLLKMLADEVRQPIVATSGNIHGSPILSDPETAMTELEGVADYFVHHDLEILNPQDDSVVKFSPRFRRRVVFRRSRGLVPNVDSAGIESGKRIMAMGGHLKSTLAFFPNDYLYLSPYLGNLDQYAVFQRFVDTADRLMEMFEAIPEVVLVDRHPAYQSTIYGKELAGKLGVPVREIQHHEAHFASVLGEHRLFGRDRDVLGVVWDGVGFGNDGQVWGGEFFRYVSGRLERISQFGYFDWLAGDKMAKEPRLSFLSLADDDMEDELVARFSKEEWTVYRSMKARNSLKTSSVGRLFDAVASLLGLCDFSTYEGEAAILMENQVSGYDLGQCTAYCGLTPEGRVPTHALFRGVYEDRRSGKGNEAIISNFLFTLAQLVFELAGREGIREIALSGGVFQNTLLVDMLLELAGSSHTLYFNRNLSPNDENISFGQLMHYLHLKD